MRRPFLLALALQLLLGFLVVSLLVRCEPGPAHHRPSTGVNSQGTRTFQGSHPIRVVATIGMIADLVANVGGAQVEVEGLMGEGVDPHLYKASPGDLQKLGRADLIFYNGLHLEGKMGDVFVRLARTRPTFAVTEALPREILREPPEFLGQYDPHVWFDVSIWARCADQVTTILAEFDPPHAPEYQKRGAEYRRKLMELHEWVKVKVKEIPEGRRLLVTAHDAFGYFGRAYGMRVRGIQGLSTDSEASVRGIGRLVEFIAEQGVKAVFVETSVSERNILALVEGCQARGHEVEIGGYLYSDAMGKQGTPDGTYLGMVRHNVETIVKALR